MSACFWIWACLALGIIGAVAIVADETVTCVVSEQCHLPCTFPPAPNSSVRWFRQDVLMPAGAFPATVEDGNATLVLGEAGLKDRGTYRCHVRSARGEHDARVVLKVEAPVRGLTLEVSRLSGYEEMKCTVRDVFPPPRVTWATEPPTFEDLRPVTRMLADKQGLYTADSKLRVLKGQPEIIYICKVSTSYGGPTWTSSLRQRAITGKEGRDLTIPCFAPPYLNGPTLRWSFSNGEDPTYILTYDSRSGRTVSAPAWDRHVELDGFRVPFGDGSLRLMAPQRARHEGTYSCVFAMPYNTHTERSDVAIHAPDASRGVSQTSHWWIVGLVAAVAALALVAMVVYLKLRGNTAKGSPRDVEEETELNSVKDPPSTHFPARCNSQSALS